MRVKRQLSASFILLSLLLSCGCTTQDPEPTSSPEIKSVSSMTPEIKEPTLTPSEIDLETDMDVGTILDKIALKLPEGREISETLLINIDGVDPEEHVVKIFNENLPDSERGQHDVYLFEQANNGDEVNEIYHDISYGMVVEWLSAQDLNNDDKEELIIGRNSGGTTNAIIWHIVYEKDGIIQSAVPASKDLADFGLDGEVYSLPGSNRIELIEEHLIVETNPLHLTGTLPESGATGGHLIIYYQFHDHQVSLLRYEIHPPEVDQTWKKYRNENQGFEISVPDRITIIEDEIGITLFHAIPHEHPDPCDFRGTGQSLEELVDFEVRIEVVEQSLFETVSEKEFESFASEYVEDNELIISPGFIDAVEVGLLHGYRITIGVEGCGAYKYYFPLNPKKTLFVRRSFITEFMSVISGYQDYLALPGIIPPAEEEELFINILSGITIYE